MNRFCKMRIKPNLYQVATTTVADLIQSSLAPTCVNKKQRQARSNSRWEWRIEDAAENYSFALEWHTQVHCTKSYDDNRKKFIDSGNFTSSDLLMHWWVSRTLYNFKNINDGIIMLSNLFPPMVMHMVTWSCKWSC